MSMLTICNLTYICLGVYRAGLRSWNFLRTDEGIWSLILGWPKSSFGFFCKLLWKNWNKLFVQPRIFPGNCQLMKKKNSSDLVADMVLLVLPLHNQQFYFDVIWEKAVFLISK